jgi:hypothetical protein
VEHWNIRFLAPAVFFVKVFIWGEFFIRADYFKLKCLEVSYYEYATDPNEPISIQLSISITVQQFQGCDFCEPTIGVSQAKGYGCHTCQNFHHYTLLTSWYMKNTVWLLLPVIVK